jgi:hypothetical protein
VAIPLSGRVLGRASGPSRSRVDDGGKLRCVSGKVIGVFRFFPSRGLYRRRGSVRSGPGGPHHRWARARARPHPWWCGRPLARLRLLFGLLEAPVNIWTSGFCFVQFQEFFLFNFSRNTKTAENRKLALWHLVNRLVPENA